MVWYGIVWYGIARLQCDMVWGVGILVAVCPSVCGGIKQRAVTAWCRRTAVKPVMLGPFMTDTSLRLGRGSLHPIM